MGLNSVFSIARSSLFAHQQALSVTSSNLANANNPRYSRQVVSFGTMSPDNRASFSFGTGVAVENVLRIRNNVTDIQIRANSHNYYDASKRSTMLKQVESYFSEPSEYGVSNLMTNFFNSWDELALEPTSLSQRNNVVQAAQTLSEKIKNVYDGINQTKLDLRQDASDTADKINSILEQINVVNKQIYEASVVKSNSNDLIDTRDALLEELSEYANINVTIDGNNVANVSIGGSFAVDGLHFKQFEVKQEDGQIRLVSEGDEIPVRLTGGSLNALIDLHNNELPKQLETLDLLASTLMENVNSIHSKGYSITDPQQTGINFFTSYEYGKLEINEEIIDDPYYLSVSSDSTEGNNSIAIEMAELRNKELIGGKTINERYGDFVSDVANEIRLQEQNTESYAIVLNQLEQTKLEYSGVSTDEEMMNVMKYQRSYDAAAKLITVADELMQTLLTLV